MIDDETLINKARSVLKPRRLSPYVDVGSVGGALVTDKGNVYVGVCVDTACSMGFCAEQAAVADMITAGENTVATIVAVNRHGKVISPCGRCREFIYQVNDDNGETRVILHDKVVTLRTLLPEHWMSDVSS
jgi:cytidine deaminase